MIIKTKLEIMKLKRAEEMSKNLLLFELINVIQGFEALGDGVQGIWRRFFEGRRRLVVIICSCKFTRT